MKTIKIMSDGNQAKVGMIVSGTFIDGKAFIGKIVAIRPTYTFNTTHTVDTGILIKPVTTHHSGVYQKLGLLWVIPNKCKIATPEQKKLYWLELEKQTIQFRPEFEAKLKELGIRDKFVNNLVNPDWTSNFTKTDIKRYKDITLSTKEWRTFINHAFCWENSPEGYEYWDNITLK